MNPCYPEKSIKITDIIDGFASQLEDYSLLLRYTYELKTMLMEGCAEDLLEKKIKERGILLHKLTESRKLFNLCKELSDIADNSSWKLQANKVLQKVCQILDTTVSLDVDNVSLTKKYIKNITLNLEKIKEGKCFLSTLGKHVDNTPSFVNICG